ncbi:MAG: PAS domain-containing sensor histidine kinase, partial [Phycisphaerales bacterium]
VHKNGNFVILETNGTPILDDKGDLLGYRGADIDITERKRAESELHETQKQLVETAHKAGMAEVATDVLHNVGNVLNSINVSTALITEKVSKSKLSNLEKVAGIINDHIEDLGTFLVEDPQGKHVPVYLTEVSKLLNNEHAEILSTLRVLNENVEHVKNIVGMQQSYAKVSGVEVSVSLTELVEDAIQINIAALERHGVQIKYELADLPPVEIDKQRVLQILVNLINNAKYALATSDIQGKLVTIRLYEHSDSRLRIEVSDNGVGISEENLSKIFNHGFTTKKDGHGFGLHSGALAAVELGGSLTAHSDGLGQGAKFTLELPFKSVEVNQRKTNATDTNVSQVNG